MHRNSFAASAVAAFALASASAHGAVTFDFTTVIAGNPQGGPTFAQLVIENDGADTVTMTFSHTADPNQAGGQAIKTLLLNIGPYVPVTVSSADPKFAGYSTSQDGKSDSGAKFDLQIDFDIAPPSDRFLAGQTVVMTATGSGLTESSFDAYSAGSAEYKGMVHLISIPPNEDSAKVVPGDPVPEPASIAGIVIGLAALLRRRRK